MGGAFSSGPAAAGAQAGSGVGPDAGKKDSPEAGLAEPAELVELAEAGEPMGEPAEMAAKLVGELVAELGVLGAMAMVAGPSAAVAGPSAAVAEPAAAVAEPAAAVAEPARPALVLAAGTRLYTPAGCRYIEDLSPEATVWTEGGWAGATIAPVRVAQMVQLRLASGLSVECASKTLVPVGAARGGAIKAAGDLYPGDPIRPGSAPRIQAEPTESILGSPNRAFRLGVVYGRRSAHASSVRGMPGEAAAFSADELLDFIAGWRSTQVESRVLGRVRAVTDAQVLLARVGVPAVTRKRMFTWELVVGVVAGHGDEAASVTAAVAAPAFSVQVTGVLVAGGIAVMAS